MEEQLTSTIVGRKQRIILFPFPFEGHLNPMIQLANILYSKGFSITILHTIYNAPKTSNFPHFTFQSILDNDPESQYSSSSKEGIRGFVDKFIFKQQDGRDALRQELEMLMLASEKEESVVSCLITDALWYFTQSVADSLNLPRLVLWVNNMFSMVFYDSISLLDDRCFFKLDNNNTDMDDQVIEELPFLKVKDTLKTGMKGKKDIVAESLMSPAMKEIKASSGIIANSFKEIEGSGLETVLNNFRVPCYLTPFAKYLTGVASAASSSLREYDRSFFPWLDQQPANSVIYVSFSSFHQVGEEKDFAEIAHGLVNSQQSFIWVVRPDSPEVANGSTWLPNGFPGEKGRIVKWAPQQEVLAHKSIGAFWTHNGWNSTMESLCEGVPMISSPLTGDQPVIARYMSDVAKVGVYLENGFERQEIASAIRRVMVDQEGTQIRERAKDFKQKLDASLLKGGSSYESFNSLFDRISSF